MAFSRVFKSMVSRSGDCCRLGMRGISSKLPKGRLVQQNTMMSSGRVNSKSMVVPVKTWIAGGIGITAIFTGLNVSRAEPEKHDEGIEKTGPSLLKKCAAEAVGTGIIVFGGCGIVAAHKYAASGVGVLGIAIGFGLSVAAAIYATGNISGAHLNPAVTLSLAINRPDDCPSDIIAPYIVSQCVGATIASALTLVTFQTGIKAMEASQKIIRGSGPASAQIFEGAFGIIPNSAMVKTTPGVLAAEIGLTAALAFMIYAITDSNNTVPASAAPALIGGTVTALILQGGPTSGAGMNPARDLGPRLVSMAAGLGKFGLTKSWWTYTIGPIIGAILGGAAYQASLGTNNDTK